MPKPSAAVPGAGEPADPWRERLAAIEVQAQATRALAQRTADDAAAMRQRAEAAEARVRVLETELGARVAQVEKDLGARGPVDRTADARPAETPEGLGERLERVDKLATQARVALDTIQQDLSEHGRLFAARKARLDSLDARVQKAENDPRLVELANKVEAFDLTLSRLLPKLEGVAELGDRVRALEHAQAEAARAEALRAEAAQAEAARAEAARAEAARAEAARAEAARLEAARAEAARVDAARAEAAGLEAARAEAAELERAAASAERAAPPATADVADEVRALKGVGPKLAKSLRQLGVTTVAQIAAWTDEDLASFASQLGTTVAKIRKAGWVQAARAAAAGG